MVYTFSSSSCASINNRQMSSNPSATRKRTHRSRQPRESSSSEDFETIGLDIIPSPTMTTNSTAILIGSAEQV